MPTRLIEIPAAIVKYGDAAVVRLGYLYPKVKWSVVTEGIIADSVDDAAFELLRKEALYAVYREKIYSDTIGLRAALLSALSEK